MSPNIVGLVEMAILVSTIPSILYAQKPKTIHEQTIDAILNQTNSPKGSAQIDVGLAPIDIAVDSVANRVHVANSSSDTVSVINGTTNTKIKDIHCREKDRACARI
jgi:YVTN family beta-propeller protein